jgi:small subunit ribosomal protein S20
LVGSSILPPGTTNTFPDMANIKSAAKRARQTKVRTTRNRSTLQMLKTIGKKSHAALEAKDKPAAAARARELSSELDRAVKRGTIHRNAANRRKSALARKLAAL